jgi:hypothetical protein
MRTVPVPVGVIRDGVDWFLLIVQVASLIGTVIAVFLAYGQIRQAREDAKAAQTAQLKERRIDFELTALRELVIAVEQVDGLRVRALASTLPKEVAQLTRAAAVLPSTKEAEQIVTQLTPPPKGWTGMIYRVVFNVQALKDKLTDELVQAIDERAREREPTG